MRRCLHPEAAYSSEIKNSPAGSQKAPRFQTSREIDTICSAVAINLRLELSRIIKSGKIGGKFWGGDSVFGVKNEGWGVKMQRLGRTGKIKIASNAQVAVKKCEKL
jgi:hypothetical protein